MVRRRRKETDGRSAEPPSASAHRALDEVRFGPAHTLNLRTHLPTGAQAAERAEKWLRERHAARAGEVLVITGRGNRSEGGVSVVRETVSALLSRLQRQGVVDEIREHTPGSFIVKLRRPGASQAARIGRSGTETSGQTHPVGIPAGLLSLDARTREVLERLARASLADIGIRDPNPHLSAEMLRQLTRLVASGAPRDDESLRVAMLAEIEKLEG